MAVCLQSQHAGRRDTGSFALNYKLWAQWDPVLVWKGAPIKEDTWHRLFSTCMPTHALELQSRLFTLLQPGRPTPMLCLGQQTEAQWWAGGLADVKSGGASFGRDEKETWVVQPAWSYLEWPWLPRLQLLSSTQSQTESAKMDFGIWAGTWLKFTYN